MAYDYQGAISAGANPSDVINYLSKQTGYNSQGALQAGANPQDVLKYMSNLPIKNVQNITTPTNIASTPFQQPQGTQPSILGDAGKKLGSDFMGRGQDVIDAVEKPSKDVASGASPLKVGLDIGAAGLNTAGAVAGGVGDILNEATPEPIKNVISSIASKAVNTDTAKKLADNWNVFQQSYPEAAKALGSVFNIATLG